MSVNEVVMSGIAHDMLDLPTITFGDLAQRLASDAPRAAITARGFLARRSMRSTQVVLHARDIEFQ